MISVANIHIVICVDQPRLNVHIVRLFLVDEANTIQTTQKH
jgi:hypothetical protein